VERKDPMAIHCCHYGYRELGFNKLLLRLPQRQQSIIFVSNTDLADPDWQQLAAAALS
jgi:hypothetical protein